MRPNYTQPDFFSTNRTRFTAKLEKSSIAVFHSNHQMPTNADGSLPFVQNSDLFYLTGINQEDTSLLLFPDASNPRFREVLFVRYADEHVLTWEGHKLSKEEARQRSGIETVLWHSEFNNFFRSLVFEAQQIYLNANEHKRASSAIKNKDELFIGWCKDNFPLHTFKRAAPILHELRAIKQSFEVNQIQIACDITHKGFERIATFIKPGVYEYELEAELSHEFIKNGAKGFAYEPIIASGPDSCVLHYTTNHKACRDGDIVLLDIAAEYGNYKSDLTRVLPVNGRFTARQKQVYQAVLNMFHFAKTKLTPSTSFEEYTSAIGEVAQEELLKLGVLTSEEVKKQTRDKPLYKKYFMHGVSHFLGLDVHDVGNMVGSFKPGMVLTCEPGIYIKEEGIGVRLENDLLITENEPTDLMAKIPIEIEEIEDLMAK